MMSRWKHAVKCGFNLMVPRHILNEMYVNFLIDKSLNVGSFAADQSVGLQSPDTLGMYSKCIYYDFQYKWNI